MVPSTSGFLGGFLSLGFPAVVFSVIATSVGKGLLLPVVADGGEDGDPEGGGLIFSKVAMWMALNLLPQLIYVSTISNETIVVTHSGGSKGLIFSKVGLYVNGTEFASRVHLHK